MTKERPRNTGAAGEANMVKIDLHYNPDQMSRPQMLEFPDEILLKIVSDLNPIGIMAMSRVCQQLNGLCKDPSLCHKFGKLISYIELTELNTCNEQSYYITNLGDCLWNAAIALSLYLSIMRQKNVIIICHGVHQILDMRDLFVRANAGLVCKAAFMCKQYVSDMSFAECLTQIDALPHNDRYNMIVMTSSLFDKEIGTIIHSNRKYTCVYVTRNTPINKNAVYLDHLLFGTSNGYAKSIDRFAHIDYTHIQTLLDSIALPCRCHEIAPMGGMGIKRCLRSCKYVFYGFPDIEYAFITALNTHKFSLIVVLPNIESEIRMIVTKHTRNSNHRFVAIYQLGQINHIISSKRAMNNPQQRAVVDQYKAIDCIIEFTHNFTCYDANILHTFVNNMRAVSKNKNIDRYIFSNPCVSWLMQPTIKQHVINLLKFTGDIK